MPQKRDDFSKATVKILKERAAYVCSNPMCKTLAIAPSPGSDDKVIYSGKASHITGASPDGPRYDASLTQKERKSIANAIFLCGVCSDNIDKNMGLDYPVDLLRHWKQKHEEWVHQHINKRLIQSTYEVKVSAINASIVAGIIQEITKIKNEFLETSDWEQRMKLIDKLFDYQDHRSIFISKHVLNFFERVSTFTRGNMPEKIGSSIDTLVWTYIPTNIGDGELEDYRQICADCIETGFNITYDALIHNKDRELAYYGCAIMRTAYLRARENNLQDLMTKCVKRFENLLSQLTRAERPELEEEKKLVLFAMSNLDNYQDLSMRMDHTMYYFVFK